MPVSLAPNAERTWKISKLISGHARDTVLRVCHRLDRTSAHPEMGCKRVYADTRSGDPETPFTPLTAFATTPSRDARVAPREELAATTNEYGRDRWVNTEAVGTRTSRPRRCRRSSARYARSG